MFEFAEIIGWGFAGKFVEQVLPEPGAKVFGNVYGRNKGFFEERLELGQTVAQMAFPFALVVSDKFFVVFEEITLELMGRNKPRTNRLPFQEKFGLFGGDQGEGFLVVVLFHLVFGAGIGEYTRRYSLTIASTVFDGEIGFVPLTVLSLHDIHNAPFCKVMK
jgi:hypothetical protein